MWQVGVDLGRARHSIVLRWMHFSFPMTRAKTRLCCCPHWLQPQLSLPLGCVVRQNDSVGLLVESSSSRNRSRRVAPEAPTEASAPGCAEGGEQHHQQLRPMSNGHTPQTFFRATWPRRESRRRAADSRRRAAMVPSLLPPTVTASVCRFPRCTFTLSHSHSRTHSLCKRKLVLCAIIQPFLSSIASSY